MTSQDDTLSVKTAIDRTLRTIEERARLYRNLVVAVSIVLIGSSVASIVLRLWWPLTGLALIVPATAMYLVLDTRLVRGWVAEMGSLQETDAMNLESFARGILSHPLLPKTTLIGMLNLLGGSEDLDTER